MTFANVGTLRVLPGRRDELIALFTRRCPELADIGCLLFEVGHCENDADTVAIASIWQNEAAYDEALMLPEACTVVEQARPLLTGDFEGYNFTVAGSPLRD